MMPADQITNNHVITAALIGAGIWVWRALAVGMRIGELTKAVEKQGEDIAYIRTKLDGHIEKGAG